MKAACVIDLDETLGVFENDNRFIIRPYAHLLLDLLIVANIDIVLWSLGSDTYVEYVINNYFDIFLNKDLQTRIFGKSASKISEHRYGYKKCSKVIRNLYSQNILLIGIDDRSNTNMDSGYDLRINAEPYETPNENDDELLLIICKLIEYCKKCKLSGEI